MPLAHIGVTHRDPHPRTGRDHRGAFNVAATNAGGAEATVIFDVPVENGLKLMAIVSSDFDVMGLTQADVLTVVLALTGIGSDVSRKTASARIG